jgi:hypothetical protein
MQTKNSYIPAVNRALRIFFQLGAARRRALQAKRGLHVPPIAIFSITNRCS